MGLDPVTISLSVAAASTAGQFIAGRQAAKHQEEAQEIGQAQQRVQEQRQRRAQARRARMRSAQIQQAAAGTGTQRASPAISAPGRIGHQVALGRGRVLGDRHASRAIGSATQSAAQAQFRQQMFGQVGRMATASAAHFASRPQPQEPQQPQVDTRDIFS